jgi:hypothetical protein
MAWLVCLGGRPFSLDPAITRQGLLDDIDSAVTNGTAVAANLAEGGVELLFWPAQLDYLLYAAGGTAPQVTTMPTVWTGTMPTTPITTSLGPGGGSGGPGPT